MNTRGSLYLIIKSKFTFQIFLLMIIFTRCNNSHPSQAEKDNFEIADSLIRQAREPQAALPYLQKVKQGDLHYEEAQDLLRSLGSLYNSDSNLELDTLQSSSVKIADSISITDILK